MKFYDPKDLRIQFAGVDLALGPDRTAYWSPPAPPRVPPRPFLPFGYEDEDKGLPVAPPPAPWPPLPLEDWAPAPRGVRVEAPESPESAPDVRSTRITFELKITGVEVIRRPWGDRYIRVLSNVLERTTGEPMTLQSDTRWPEGEAWDWAVRRAILTAVEHEALEAIEIDGVRVFDPHPRKVPWSSDPIQDTIRALARQDKPEGEP